MFNRKEITAALEAALLKYINAADTRTYWAREVTFDHGTSHTVRVDLMQFKPVNNSVSGIEQGVFCCYEIKSCVDDFHSKNGHNFLADYNYYVMPQEVFEAVEEEIPFGVGVLTPDGSSLKSVQKARRKSRSRPFSEMIFMMFRSAARDRIATR